MKGKSWRIVAALMLVVSLVLAIQAMASATGEGVNQVSAIVSDAERNPDDTVDITAVILTGKSDDVRFTTGSIKIQDPGAVTRTGALTGGTGSGSETLTYPGGDFDGGTTTATGTYKVWVTLDSTDYGSIAEPLATFEVKDYYISVSPGRIVGGGTTTITVNTAEASWGGTITVTEPSAGGSDTATYTFSAGQTGDQTTTAFPGGAGWSGSADTAAAGVYTISLDETENTGVGEDDTGTFDVQNPNPHVAGAGFAATTDACASCHRTHTGVAAKLLKSGTQYNLCTSCHDGSGANTKVTDGIYLGSTEGSQNAGLRAGGFVNALMDTDVDGSMASTAITSKHTIGATSPVVWGSGSLGDNDAGEIVGTLECGSCHNPHGNSQYRVLRPQPTGLSTDKPTSDVTVADETTTNYTISYDASYYRDLGKYPTGALSQMSEWCGQCHQRYEAGAGSGSTARGDTVFTYSHMTEGLGGECLKCHVAHGSSASMSGNAATSQITWPAGTSATWQDTGEDDYSRLLHIDNRGVCLQCHTDTELSSN